MGDRGDRRTVQLRSVRALSAGVLLVLSVGCTSSAQRSARAGSPRPVDSPALAPPSSAVTTSVPSTTAATTTTAEPAPTRFAATVVEVDEARLGLSWRPGCPVGAQDLRLLTLVHHTFDGELIVHRSIVESTVAAFEELWDLGFPINRMETADAFIRPEDIADDGTFINTVGPDLANDTSAFMCRQMTGSNRTWSEHSYGTAIDINPVQNPYVKGDLVVPMNGIVPRDPVSGGMLTAASPAVRAFSGRGFVWGGTWTSLKDYMHFSVSGR